MSRLSLKTDQGSMKSAVVGLKLLHSWNLEIGFRLTFWQFHSLKTLVKPVSTNPRNTPLIPESLMNCNTYAVTIAVHICHLSNLMAW